MSSRAHEPREQFVDELEIHLRAELRRQSLASAARPWSWMPQSRWAASLALSAVMVVSMALGGSVVAATYEARLGGQRDVLLATFDQRFAIAQQRLALTKRQLQDSTAARLGRDRATGNRARHAVQGERGRGRPAIDRARYRGNPSHGS